MNKTPSLQSLTNDQKITVLLAAYNKHATELLALEESQQKLVVMLLGIFSVGIASLDKLHPSLPKFALILVTLALAGFGTLYTFRRNAARKAIRGAIVNIEIALRFYEDGEYLQNQSFYPKEFQEFPERNWLAWIYWTVIIVALIFIYLVATK